MGWGSNVNNKLKKVASKTDHKLVRKVKPSHLSKADKVQSIYTNVRNFIPNQSKSNLVFDENRNVITKRQALGRIIREQNKKNSQLDRQIAALNRKYQTLSAKRYQVNQMTL